tara:strand:+ start:1846 stop:2322 length:477 start_codon:yes stop_codon:yes gene_type:complete
MRFVKKQQLNSKLIEDNSVSVDARGQVVLGTDYAVKVPMGPTSTRPSFPENGQIRYNTDTNEFEFYVGNAWENARTNRPATITVQTLGTGDSSNQEFGPLNPVPLAAQNIFVLVENVVQIAGVNYTIVQNPSGKNGSFVRFDSAVPLGKDVVVLHGFD